MRTIPFRSLLVASVLVAAGANALAEPEIKGSPTELSAYLAALPGTVQIAGEGEIKTPADRAIVSLRIDNENKSLAEAIKLNHAVRAKLATFLKEQGVGAERVQSAPFASTQKTGVFTDKVKSHKVSTLVKVTTHNEQEFHSVTKALDQFAEVAYVRAEFEHSDKEALKAKAAAKACDEAERQKRVYEERLGVKLLPKRIQDERVFPAPLPARRYVESGDYGITSGLRSTPLPASADISPEATGVDSPFGELVFSARVMVEYSIERK